jgi:L-threonylcarbamoyladenylate synthase
LTEAGLRVAVMTRTIVAGALPAETHPLTMPIEPADYGRQLYASLRRLDDGDFDIIVVEQPPDNDSWRAVNDRLGRASHGASS